MSSYFHKCYKVSKGCLNYDTMLFSKHSDETRDAKVFISADNKDSKESALFMFFYKTKVFIYISTVTSIN